MLSISALTLEQASSYYTKGEEYYADVNNPNVEYLDAKMKGIPLQADNFHEWLKRDMNNKKTACYDLTFSAPKSVSLAIALAQTEQLRSMLLGAHIQAVKDTLETIDEHTYANIKHEDVKNGPLEIALITHDTSRLLDPQTHTHCVVKNGINGAPLDAQSLYRNKMKYGREYRLRYMNLLKAQGFQVEVVDFKQMFFEVKGVDNLIEFSKRSLEIKQASPSGSAKDKAYANLSTRKAKDHNVPPEELKSRWLAEYGSLISLDTQTPIQMATQEDISLAIKEASERLTEHKSYFTDLEINNAAREALLVRNLVIPPSQTIDLSQLVTNDNYYYASPKIVKAEAFIKNECKRTHQIFEPLVSQVDSVIDSWVQQEKLRRMNPDFDLTKSQRQTLKNILSSRDGVNIIQGDAGTGKTALLKALNDIIGSSHSLLGLSTTGKATLEMQEDSGIQSITIARFLLMPKKEVENGIFIIDESSMNSTFSLEKVFQYARKYNVRLILQGDSKQLASINAGGMFDELQENSFVTYSQLTDNVRQQTSVMKSVVKDLAPEHIKRGARVKKVGGHAKRGLQTLDNAGCILEIPGKQDALDKMVSDYVNLDSESKVMLTNRNVDRDALNNLTKANLIKKGVVSSEQHSFKVRTNKNLSDYDKKYAHNYSVGDVVILNNRHPYLVTSVDLESNKITISYEGRIEKTIVPNSKLEVYSESTRSFSIGDKVVCLKNYSPVNNGTIATVKDIQDSGILLTIAKGKESKEVLLDVSKYNYLDLGYCVTNYKFQGGTADEVFMYSTGEETAESVYVAATRARNNMRFYVENKSKLFESLGVHNKQVSAIKKLNSTRKRKVKIKSQLDTQSTVEVSPLVKHKKSPNNHKEEAVDTCSTQDPHIDQLSIIKQLNSTRRHGIVKPVVQEPHDFLSLNSYLV